MRKLSKYEKETIINLHNSGYFLLKSSSLRFKLALKV